MASTDYWSGRLRANRARCRRYLRLRARCAAGEDHHTRRVRAVGGSMSTQQRAPPPSPRVRSRRAQAHEGRIGARAISTAARIRAYSPATAPAMVSATREMSFSAGLQSRFSIPVARAQPSGPRARPQKSETAESLSRSAPATHACSTGVWAPIISTSVQADKPTCVNRATVL
jgi:hypothetical protein